MRTFGLASMVLGLAMGMSAAGCGGATSSGTDAAVRADAGTDAATVDDASVVADAGSDAATLLDAATSPDAAQEDAGPPRACGGRGTPPCRANEFCNFPLASICGRADGPGVCETIPTECPAGTAQVCGCNGTTYESECLANAAGTSVDHAGPCLTP